MTRRARCWSPAARSMTLLAAQLLMVQGSALAGQLRSDVAATHTQLQGRVIFVAPDGDDHASGAAASSPLASCAAATMIVQEICDAENLPLGGIEVRFAAGRYKLSRATACGTLTCRATAEAPVVFRAAGDGEVVFDGSRPLGHTMHAVTNATVRALLNPAVVNDVKWMFVESASGWTGIGQVLQWGDRPLTPSVWPNTGLGYIKQIWDSGAIYCPGRTKGPIPVCQICTGDERSSQTKPCGANFSLTENPTGDWERELLAGPGFGGDQVTLDGYVGADWFHETHTIVRVVRADDSNRTTSVQLGESSHYGVCEAMEGKGPGCSGSDEGGAPGRFHVHGLLSNVDQPGEYFFDRSARRLYLVPPKETGGLGFWAGPGLISIVNSSHITVRDIVVTGSASLTGALEAIGGDNITFGGCTVRSCVAGIALRGGHQNAARGNDVFDMTGFHIVTSSDENETLEHSQNKLVPTNNLVSNNHFTQIYLATTTWSVHAGGVGDRFSHNLIHDAPGQVILAGGPLTMWDHNEVMNTGYAEGDGGMMYLHASLVKGYGMHIRENFLHHSLDVPGLIGRHAIQFDDHFGAVSNCSGNVLYKAAGIGIATSGAGNNVTNNLIVNSGMAIAVSALEDMTINLKAYDNGTLKRGDKMDYVWNAENDLGIGGDFPSLFKTALAERFPTFARLLSVNSTHEGWASAGSQTFTDNVFLNNSQGNVCIEDAERHDGKAGVHMWHCSGGRGNAGHSSSPIAPLSNGSAFGLPDSHYVDWSGSIDAEWSWFAGAAQLEFFNASLRFDTRQSGLFCDGWRRRVPDAKQYRPFVKRAFDGVPALPAHGHYTPEAAELRSRVRTGRALVQNFTVPCPALGNQDCVGIWLAWGECQRNNKQLMRYTIDTPALMRGKRCPWLDGYTKFVSCQ